MTAVSTFRPLAAAVLTFALSLPLAAGAAHAAPGHGGKAPAIGAAGKASEAARTVEVTMYDNYYEPESISVQAGETVRFVVRNAGEFVHEFSIATAAMHKAHQPKMMMMMEHGVLEADRINMEAAKAMHAAMGHGMHDDANSVLLEPGKTGEMVWTFPAETDLEFACNVPGHYDAGMMGRIELSR